MLVGKHRYSRENDGTWFIHIGVDCAPTYVLLCEALDEILELRKFRDKVGGYADRITERLAKNEETLKAARPGACPMCEGAGMRGDILRCYKCNGSGRAKAAKSVCPKCGEVDRPECAINRQATSKQDSEPASCPTCGCKDPDLHPAVQQGGEVQICPDAFHTPRCPKCGEKLVDVGMGTVGMRCLRCGYATAGAQG